MRILHVIAQLPQKTGSGVYFTNVIEELKNYGNIEQTCLYGTTEEYDINILKKEKQYEVVFQNENLPFPIVGMSDIMPYENTLYSEMSENMIKLWRKAFTEKLRQAKKEFNPDIIITHHLWILTSIVCEIFKDKKIFAICHNTDLRQAEKNRIMKEKYVSGFEHINMIFSLSDLQTDDIVKIYKYDKNKIFNLGAGYNEKLFYPPKKYEKKDKIELLYIGKFDQAKGFYELIKAFRIISEKREDVKLTLVGAVKDENRKEIENAVKGIKNIEIYNLPNQQAVAEVMREKDVFILPSYFEGLGLIAVEALGSGLRAVTTNIAGLIELLGDKINNSGIIEYIDMPTIYDTDKAVEAEKPDFVKRLVKGVEKQMKKSLEKREIDEKLLEEIRKNSWKSKIEILLKIISEK